MQKSHKLNNTEVVIELKEMLAAMEVTNANVFRIRAYQNAIAAIDNSTVSVYDLWKNDRLSEIPGVGPGLEQHLDELFRTGKVSEFEHTKSGLPDGMFSLIGLRQVGAKKAFKLAKAFDLNDRETALEELKKAAEQGKISELDGFGEKSEQAILEAITETKTHKREKTRMLLVTAETVALRVINHLEKLPEIEKVEVLGSFRRRESTIGDLDIAVSTKNPEKAIEHFLKFEEIEDVLNKGDKKAGVVLKTDVQIDLRVIEPKLWGSMVQYFTGSKQHNVILRTHALDKGLSLSEYGIKENGEIIEFDNEPDFYKKIGLPYIPPELRQGKEEVDRARDGKIPELVTLEDIRGDIHTHTIASDGTNTLKEMVDAAIEKKYEYIGIADHSPSIASRGEKEVLSIIDKRCKNIEQINSSQDDIRVLFGYEVNILVDTTLSLPDEYLEKLDYVIASVHSAFNQSRDEITERVAKAIENPLVDIIGHPSGRLINERPSIDLDWDKVLSLAKKHDKILEINAQPNRLDLPFDLVKDALQDGIKLMINTDAHSTESLDLMRYGVDVARRGWCERKHILNALPLSEFLRVLDIDE
jgi:DNA polymerase (family 10)